VNQPASASIQGIDYSYSSCGITMGLEERFIFLLIPLVIRCREPVRIFYWIKGLNAVCGDVRSFVPSICIEL
jgi:hypothetical protein